MLSQLYFSSWLVCCVRSCELTQEIKTQSPAKDNDITIAKPFCLGSRNVNNVLSEEIAPHLAVIVDLRPRKCLKTYISLVETDNAARCFYLCKPIKLSCTKLNMYFNIFLP